MLPEGTWEQLDQVDVAETCLIRVPMLKSCPHFLRGRLRECLAMTLREKYRAKTVHDSVGEDRAWKAFALVPMMLLNKPKGWVQWVGTSWLSGWQIFERRVVDTSGGRTWQHAKVAIRRGFVGCHG